MAAPKSIEEQIADLEEELQALAAEKQADRDAIQQQLVALRAQQGETQADASAGGGLSQQTGVRTGATAAEATTELPASLTVTRPGVGQTAIHCTLFERHPRAGPEAEEAYALDYYGAKAFSRYLQRLAPCNGTKDLETLKWLRLIKEEPSDLRIALATEAATRSLLNFILKALDEDITWPALKLAIACEYINPDFACCQRDTLQLLQQRAGESIVSYNYEFSMLADEAYPQGVDDPVGLVRDYLFSLADRGMAARVMQKQPQTLEEAMALMKEQVQVAEKTEAEGKGVSSNRSGYHQ